MCLSRWQWPRSLYQELLECSPVFAARVDLVKRAALFTINKTSIQAKRSEIAKKKSKLALESTALLARLEIDPRRVAVEHNLNVVKRGAYDATEVRDGDQIEIVNFVGGG